MGGLLKRIGIGGGGKKPQVPPDVTKPAPPRIFGMNLIGGLRGRAFVASLEGDAGWVVLGNLESESRLSFTVPADYVGGASIRGAVVGTKVRIDQRIAFDGQTVDQLGSLPAGSREADPIRLDWSKEIPAPRGYTIDGQFFRDLETGVPVFELGASFFSGLERHRRGEIDHLRDALGQLRGLGFTSVRSFTGLFFGTDGAAPTPTTLPTIDELRAWWEFCASQGMRVLQTVFPIPALTSPAEQAEYLYAVVDEAQSCPWVRIEGVNEGDHHLNVTPGLELVDPVVVVRRSPTASHGSTIQNAAELLPVWGTIDYHPARNAEWPRKVGHNAWEKFAERLRVPVIASEIMRPDQCGYDRLAFYQAGANAKLFCAGVYFHSTPGKGCGFLRDRDLECAQALIYGAADVPIEFRQGRYTASHLHECPVSWNLDWEGQVYAKILGDRAVAIVSAAPQRLVDTVTPIRGWGLVERKDTGSVIHLAR